MNRNKAILLFSIFFLLFFTGTKAQVFKELHSFTLYADSITNYSSIWIDVDQDYDLDLLTFSVLNKPNQLYTQQDRALMYTPGVFEKDGGNANGACYADIDLDGDLDIFVYSIFGQKNYLYIQESKGLFRKEFLPEIVQQENNAFYACFSDLNFDNYPDLIITDTELWNPKSIKRPTRIYFNDGKGNFSKQKMQRFFVPKSDTRGILLADLNQDAREDLLLLNFGSENELYLKKNDYSFEKTSTNFTITKGDYTDAQSIDFDNDGDLDVFLVNLKSGIDLYRNDGHLLFTKVEDVFSVANFPISGIEALDYNNDGSMDILLHKSFSKEKKLFLNQNTQHNFLKLKLRANRANSDAIGAKVYVSTNVGGRDYWQFKEVKGNKHANIKDAFDLHFGLADSKEIDSVKLIWPDGTVQILRKLIPNQTYFIEQGAKENTVAKSNMFKAEYEPIKELSVSLVADNFKYGEIAGITVFYENKGLVEQDIELTITLTEAMKLFNSFPMPTTYTKNSFVYKIKHVPAQYRGIVTLSVSTPNIEETSAKEQLISVGIEPQIGDENSDNNRAVLLKKIE